MNDSVQELLSRGVEEIFVKSELEQALQSKRKISVYYGVDPSGPAIHLGHAVLLRKLQILQELGHEIIFLIGDFTGMIGDPTDKNSIRQPLTRKEVLANAKTYKKQVSKFLNFTGKNPARIVFNSKWNDNLKFKDVIELSGKFTVQQFLERDMFQKRIKEGKPIGLHEFLYPLVQGYDAAVLEADMQIGGTDQTFNMLQGRYLTKALKNKTQMVLTCELLVGTDGRKMSKSFNNVIDIDDEPNEMFGKVMSINDELIKKYFVLATRVPLPEVDEIIATNSNPRDQKIILAEKITEFYHGLKKAESAKANFINQFSKHSVPSDIETKIVSLTVAPFVGTYSGISGLSKSEIRRLMKQGGVEVDGKKLTEDVEIDFVEPKTVRVGRKYTIIKFKK